MTKKCLFLALFSLVFYTSMLFPQKTEKKVLAATLLWSEAFSVGQVHGGSGLRITNLGSPNWYAPTSKSIKAFRVRPGLGKPNSPWLWLAGGDLLRAVDVDKDGTDRFFGPPWACEVMDVIEEEQRVWIAWTGGVAYTDDFGKTWKDVSKGLPSTFVSVLAKLNNKTKDIIAGTEKGIAVWNEKKNRFDRILLSNIPIRFFLPLKDNLYIGTFRNGIYKIDIDLNEKPVSLGLDGVSVEGIAYLDGIIYCATDKLGLVRRCINGPRIKGEDELGAWQTIKEFGVDTSGIVAIKGKNKNIELFVSTYGKGVWASRDGGKTWNPFGLEGGHVSSLCLVPKKKIKEKTEPVIPETKNFDERKKAVKNWFIWLMKKRETCNFYTLKWMLENPETKEGAVKWLISALKNPKGDMFFQYSAIGAWFKVKDMLPEWIKGFYRYTLLSYDGFRGDTENHLCMWHTALYLTACAFPDAGPKLWHTGLSSYENKKFAKDYLKRWMMDVFKYGQMEYDSPHYMAYFIGPMLILYDYAEDEDLRQGAKAMLDLILADFAEENFKGIYAGGHSREPRYKPFDMDWDAAGSIGYLYFGTKGKGTPGFHPVCAFACQSQYTCPDIIKNIAKDRSGYYLIFERKRVRNMWRYHKKRNPPVYKLTYMTPSFAIGSTQGGLLQPIQQHTWDASWRDDEGYARTLFTLHPYASAFELSTFFPEGPGRMLGVIEATKSTYLDENKWVSASPYERIFQYKSTVIAFYNIPKCERYPHVDAYLPLPQSKIIKAKKWYLLESGPVFAGIYCTEVCKTSPAPKDGTRLRVFESPCVFVIEIQEKNKWDSFGSFKKALLDKKPKFDKTKREVTYKNLDGVELKYIWPNKRYINGSIWDYPSNKLFKSPWIESDFGTGKIEIKYEGKKTIIDIDKIFCKGGK